MPWPLRDRDTTQYPDLQLETRKALQTVFEANGSAWDSLGADSRLRTVRKVYERHLVIENLEGKVRLTPLGVGLEGLLGDFERLLPRVRKVAANSLARYQFQNPIEDNDPMNGTDVRPWLVVYQALSKLEWKLHWQEVNRVLCNVGAMSDLDAAIDKIRDARLTIGDYATATAGDLSKALGPEAIADQPQARIAPVFSIAGCGGLLIGREADNGFRYAVEAARPILKECCDTAGPFKTFSTAKEWAEYLWGSHSVGSSEEGGNSSLVELASTVNLAPSFLEEMIGSLEGPLNQLILGGPPGTGKSFVASQIARYLARGNGSPNAVRLIQFHPSYGYEEFVEGREPEVVNGAVRLVPKPGLLVKMAEDVEASGQTHVLIIDEINRANLHRVLGELMYLLEYRDQSIDLMHRNNFRLPAKLLIIGTMNTVDRSLATLDMAMYRRFNFFKLWPDVEVLRAHYSKDGNVNLLGSILFEGFEQLNAALVSDLDQHYQVGHSYFMDSLMSPEAIDRVWRRQIEPLLEQFFFDQPNVFAAYSRERFWP